jgi:hypothetical protein
MFTEKAAVHSAIVNGSSETEIYVRTSSRTVITHDDLLTHLKILTFTSTKESPRRPNSVYIVNAEPQCVDRYDKYSKDLAVHRYLIKG